MLRQVNLVPGLPLHAAVEAGQREVAQMLLNQLGTGLPALQKLLDYHTYFKFGCLRVFRP